MRIDLGRRAIVRSCYLDPSLSLSLSLSLGPRALLVRSFVRSFATAVYGTVLEISIAILAGVNRESVYDLSYDIIGAVILIVVTFVLCLSNRSSSFLLLGANLVGVILAIFTAIAGFTQASGEVFSSDWNPGGGDGDGLFPSLPYLMFAFTGFEAPSYSVEEAIDPAKDILPAYLWTLGISMPIYLLLALSLAFMVNMQELQLCQYFDWQGVPTSCPDDRIERYWIGVVYAFSKYGMTWMKYIFAVGAMINIMTSLLVSLYITARLMMVGAREWLLPPVLATVSVRTREPIYATLLAGFIAAILCLFLSYNSMANLVGFAYLLINLLVSNVYLARRFWPGVKLRYTRYGNVEAAAPRFMNEIDGGALTGGFSSVVRSIDVSSRGTNQSTFKSDTESRSLPIPCSPRHSTPLQTLPEARKEEQQQQLQQQGTDAEINTSTDTDGDSNATYATNASSQTSTNPRLWKFLRIEHRMTKKTHRWMVVLFLVAINGTGVATGVVRRLKQSHHFYAYPFVAWIIVTLLMWLMCPIEYEPKKWHIHRHLLPFVPSVAILGFTFLACWIQEVQQYTASLIIIGSVALVYVFFSMPLSYIRKHSTWVTSTDVREIDLVYRESKEMWIGVDELTSRPSFKNKNTFAGAHSAGG